MTVESGLRHNGDEELRTVAVGIARHTHRRHRAGGMLLVAGLCDHQSQPAAAIFISTRRIFREGITALDDPAGHHAVKTGTVKPAVGNLLHDQPDMIRSGVWQQVDHEAAHSGFDDYLLVAHLLDAERRLKRVLAVNDQYGCDEVQQQRRQKKSSHDRIIQVCRC